MAELSTGPKKILVPKRNCGWSTFDAGFSSNRFWWIQKFRNAGEFAGESCNVDDAVTFHIIRFQVHVLLLCLKNILNPQSSQSVHIFPYIYICVYPYIYYDIHIPNGFRWTPSFCKSSRISSLGLKKPANRSYRFRIVDLEIEKKVGSIYIYTGWWLTYPSEKYWSNGNIIPNIWKNEKCSTPPTSMYIYILG